MKTCRNFKSFLLNTLTFLVISTAIAQDNKARGTYNLIIEGFDWGPAVNKVVLDVGTVISEASTGDYTVKVSRSMEGVEFRANEASGQRDVVYAYVSDESGRRTTQGKYVTLTLFVGPDEVLGSPIKYVRVNNRGSNRWIDYKMTITNADNSRTWNTETKRFRPDIDNFDLTGRFSHTGELTLTYASYTPETNREKSPLIIWLHGGGEGGTDPSIPLVANLAANYASDDIQKYFKGAYVLAPQSPTFWMQSETGEYTRGNKNDIYNEALKALIDDYVKDNPGIDTNRIYVGGCSNGGYMALKLILLYPDYFAAGYISALAYQSQYISDEQIHVVKDVPLWFVHSADDKTTVPEQTVLPVYKRLIAAGGKNIHLSFYDHVTDIRGFFGGDDYHYNGHWSWIYSHANHADFDFNGEAVRLQGRPVSIMEWMAAQSR
ncbi:MAG: prolyl oligopeptidase family serine peptidase [Eudoraea sp.]|nr:prolyl oligopeptidase family serine peptidase [Eudoraea sp.]